MRSFVSYLYVALGNSNESGLRAIKKAEGKILYEKLDY